MSFDPNNITQEQRDALWAAWVEALESGKYTQIKGCLERLDHEGNVRGNCCLGVACRVFDEMFPGVLRIRTEYEACTSFNGADSRLPLMAKDALGLTHLNPRTAVGGSLAELNDLGTPFPEIAGIVRRGEVKLAHGVKVTAFAK